MAGRTRARAGALPNPKDAAADTGFQKFFAQLGWPEDCIDTDYMKKEAHNAKFGRDTYGFMAPEELDRKHRTRATERANRNRYVKMLKKGPVSVPAPRIHESADNHNYSNAPRSPSRYRVTGKFIGQWATDNTARQHQDQPLKTTTLPQAGDEVNVEPQRKAGIAPKARTQTKANNTAKARPQTTEVQSGPDTIKTTDNPAVYKGNKKHRKARPDAAVVASAQATRRSERGQNQQKTSQQDHLAVDVQAQDSGAANPKTSVQKAAPSDQRSISTQNDVEAPQQIGSTISLKRKATEPPEDAKPAKRAAAKRSKPKLVIAKTGNKGQTAGVSNKRKAEDDVAGEPAKRPRITHACDMCRLKKTKCNGINSCEACQKRGSTCVYSEGPAPVLSSKIKKDGGSASAIASATSTNPNAVKASSAEAKPTQPASSNPEPSKAAPKKAAPKSTSSAIVTRRKATSQKALSHETTSVKPPISRQSRACDQCRIKKTKCDGCRPCDACSKRNFTCTYGAAEAFPKVKESPDDGGPSDAPGAFRGALNNAASTNFIEPSISSRPVSTRGPSATSSARNEGQNLADIGRNDVSSATCLAEAAASNLNSKRKFTEDLQEPKVQCRPLKRSRIILHFRAHGAKLRRSLAEEALEVPGLPNNIQQSIQERLELKMRDMMIWKLYCIRNQSPEWNIDDRLQEESFHNRPSIKLVIPDLLKGLLVDDWENVTKSGQYVQLPHEKATVQKILEDYLAVEKPNREVGSTQMDILEETIDGLREYFDKALGRILLYRSVSLCSFAQHCGRGRD